MGASVRTIVTVLPGLTPGTWHVDVEESCAESVFSPAPDYAFNHRRFQMPTVYRSRRTAERAGRSLAMCMGGVFRLPPEHA
jgi:hypothetical protein